MTCCVEFVFASIGPKSCGGLLCNWLAFGASTQGGESCTSVALLGVAVLWLQHRAECMRGILVNVVAGFVKVARSVQSYWT